MRSKAIIWVAWVSLSVAACCGHESFHDTTSVLRSIGEEDVHTFMYADTVTQAIELQDPVFQLVVIYHMDVAPGMPSQAVDDFPRATIRAIVHYPSQLYTGLS